MVNSALELFSDTYSYIFPVFCRLKGVPDEICLKYTALVDVEHLTCILHETDRTRPLSEKNGQQARRVTLQQRNISTWRVALKETSRGYT